MNSEAPRPGAQGQDRSELAAIVRKATTHFLVAETGDRPLADFEKALSGSAAPYREIGKAFVTNMRGLLSTVTIPYSLAQASAVDRHYQRISSAERIRSLMLGQAENESAADLDVRRERVAREKADALMEAFLASEEGSDAMIRDVCQFLLRSIGSESFALAAEELLRQGTVLCWGAFEVLARDVFVGVVNLNPSYVDRLINDPVAKRRFELTRVPVDVLLLHGFDLSEKMGTLLAAQQDLSDLNSLKAVYGALFPAASGLKDSLNDPNVRLLSQRRHVVVHRRGVVDETYVKATGFPERLGELLRVSPDSLEQHVATVLKFAVQLFQVLEESGGGDVG